MGNSLARSGYGCALPTMVASWREAWSATPGTTDSLAPFGIATLAAGGSEGASNHMSGMRWSETGNYGHWDNAALPNTFGSQEYAKAARPLLLLLSPPRPHAHPKKRSDRPAFLGVVSVTTTHATS